MQMAERRWATVVQQFAGRSGKQFIKFSTETLSGSGGTKKALGPTFLVREQRIQSMSFAPIESIRRNFGILHHANFARNKMNLRLIEALVCLLKRGPSLTEVEQWGSLFPPSVCWEERTRAQIV